MIQHIPSVLRRQQHSFLDLIVLEMELKHLHVFDFDSLRVDFQESHDFLLDIVDCIPSIDIYLDTRSCGIAEEMVILEKKRIFLEKWFYIIPVENMTGIGNC